MLGRMLLVSKRWRACAEYAFSCMKKLDFSTSFGDIDRIMLSCLLRVKVDTISFANCWKLDNEKLKWISQSPSAPLVKDLDFTKCHKITENGLLNLTSQITQNLQRLVLTKSGVKSLSKLSLPNLEYLGLAEVSSLASNFFSTQHPKIRTVDLTKANVSTGFFENLLQNCPNLENIYLSETNPSLVEKLLDVNLKLKSIDLSWLGLSDNLVNKLIQKYPTLEHIDLGNNEITDQSIITMSIHCTQLIGLNISQCFRITNQSLNSLIDNCPKLRYLNVDNCDFITIEDLRHYKYKTRDLYIKAKRDLMNKLSQ